MLYVSLQRSVRRPGSCLGVAVGGGGSGPQMIDALAGDGLGCRAAQQPDAVEQRREALVAGQTAAVAGVDLLRDDRDLEQAEDVIEEDPGGVAAGGAGVALPDLGRRQV